MAQGVVLTFDPDADAAVRELWRRLATAGLAPAESFPPHLTLAMAGEIPKKTRDALRSDLRMLSIPNIWFGALSTFTTTENVLMLSAVVDTELLAVHSAVHDVLAGRVRNPSAYYLPGNWVPHCTLTSGLTDADLVRAFGAVLPVGSITARAAGIAVLDTTSTDIDVLV